MADKTRAERIEEAATKFCDAARCSTLLTGVQWEFNDLEQAIALPPDPPRDGGWAAMRELRTTAEWNSQYGSEVEKRVARWFIREIDRLLAAAPKETP